MGNGSAATRSEVRAAMRWWRKQNPDRSSARPIHHPYFGWVIWATEWESGPVAKMEDVIEGYRSTGNGKGGAL